MKKIVYRSDGCVDFLATKAVREGSAMHPDDLKRLQEYDPEMWQDFIEETDHLPSSDDYLWNEDGTMRLP